MACCNGSCGVPRYTYTVIVPQPVRNERAKDAARFPPHTPEFERTKRLREEAIRKALNKN